MSNPIDRPEDNSPELHHDDLERGTIDFNSYTELKPGSDELQQVSMSDPARQHGGLTWTALAKLQPAGSDDEVFLGSLPELEIDAISDNAILKHLERETTESTAQQPPADKSGIHRVERSGGVRRVQPAKSSIADSRPIAALAQEVSGAEGWFRGLDDNDSSVSLGQTGTDSGKKLGDSSDALAASMDADDGTSRVNLGMDAQLVKIMAAEGWQPPIAEVAASPRPVRTTSRANLELKQPRSLNSWFGGLFLGVAGAALVGLGLFLGGVIRPREVSRTETTPPASTPPTESSTKPSAALARLHLENGEPDKALTGFLAAEESPATLTGRGQARWLAYLRQQKQKKAPLSETDPAVVEARKELVASRTADAALWLGLINESFGHLETAREAYSEGRNKFPERARLFSAALARLDALKGPAPKPAAKRIDLQLGLALSLILMELPPDSGGVADEAGFDFWDAVGLVRQGDYSSGIAKLQKARAAHEARRDLTARRGPNPESDPRDEIFLHSCDQIQAYWEVRAKLSAAGFKLESQSPGQAIDSLLTNQQKLETAVKNLNDALKTEKAKDNSAALEALAEQRRKAEANWQQAETALKASKAELAKKEDQLKEIEKSLSAGTQADAALKAARNELARKDERLTAFEKAAITWQQTEAALKEARAELTKKSERLTVLEKAALDLQQTESALQTARKELIKKDEQLTALEKSLKDLQQTETALKAVRIELAKKDERLASVEKTAADLRQSEAALAAARMELAKKADQLTADLQQNEAALKAVRTELAKKDARVAALEKSLGDGKQTDAALKAARTELAKTEERLIAVEKVAADLPKIQADLKAARLDLVKKNDQLAEIEKAAAEQLKVARDREQIALKALDDAATARKAAEDSYRAIFVRLSQAKLVGEQAGPDELIKALDVLLRISAASEQKDAELARLQALLRKATSVTVQAPPKKPDAQLAEKLLAEGMQSYFDRDFAAADAKLGEAYRNNERDARILYFLGFARWRLGESDQAIAAFRQGAVLERRTLPSTEAVNATLERVQGEERVILSRYR